LSLFSVLAAKVAGYPVSAIAAKLGLGIPHDEIKDSVHDSTKVASTCFEPIVKSLRWE
jgi:carbamoyl-phosphate synthase / aspartate carbamoyltransferase